METIRIPLKHFSKLERTNRWIFLNIKNFLGQRILEAGCGNGNLTKFYLSCADFVVAADIDAALLNELSKRYSSKNLEIARIDLTQNISFLKKYRFDTIVCLNALEHIQEEEKVLKNFYSILTDKGKLIIQVPAFHFLYGTIDKAIGHYRRYEQKQLNQKIETAGFSSIKCFYFNFFGIFGWFLNGKILRLPYLSLSLLSLFDFLLPIFQTLEKWFRPPIGLSLIMIAEKK